MIIKKRIVVLLSILGLILITVGATYAWLSYSKAGSKEYAITVGSITFHYQESSQGLTLDDAMPMTDVYGKNQNKYFEFTITSKVLDTVEIPYDITVKRSGTGTNMDSVVKVYLTKVDSNVEKPVEMVAGKEIVTVSELAAYLNSTLNIDATKNERKLTTETVQAGSTDYKQTYRLRMWISDTADFSGRQTTKYYCNEIETTQANYDSCDGKKDIQTVTEYPYNNKTYTLKVNVYGAGKEFTGLLPGLYDSNDNLIKSWSELESLGITKENIEKNSSYNSTVSQALKSNNLSGHLVLPSTIEKIGNNVFNNSSNLEGITIPNSVQTIGSSAFNRCNNLSSIIIPEGVTYIGSQAFAYARNLKNIEISSTVRIIANDSFVGTKLSSIKVDSNNKTYDSRDNSNTIIDTAKNELMVSSTSNIIPNSVSSIGTYAFDSRTDITSITIPNSVQKIGSYAFSGCINLVSIDIPDSVVSIGNNAFFDCAKLESIVIPTGVDKIASSTFRGCSNLSSITLPNGIVSIDTYAFFDCTNLKSIVIPSSVKWIGMDVFGGSGGLTSATFENNSSWYVVDYNSAFDSDEFDAKKTLVSVSNPTTAAQNLKRYDMHMWVLNGDFDNLSY